MIVLLETADEWGQGHWSCFAWVRKQPRLNAFVGGSQPFATEDQAIQAAKSAWVAVCEQQIPDRIEFRLHRRKLRAVTYRRTARWLRLRDMDGCDY